MIIGLDLFKTVLFGNKPNFPNLVMGGYGDIPHAGLSLGTVLLGFQGSGKTSKLAEHLVVYARLHPGEAIFVLDWSGSISDTLLNLLNQDRDRDALIKRVVYDDMGNSEWATPLPEFSPEYGDFDDQVQRVATNLTRLAPELVKNAPILGGISLAEIGPEIFRVATAVTNTLGENWQITEAKRLIQDEKLLRQALNIYGFKVPSAKWWLEKTFLQIKPQERELRTYSLVALLSAIEPKSVRARIGYYRPAWTPKEAIEKGLIVICDGAKLINKRDSQHYLFMQVYSLIMEEINRRRPGDPKDKPVSLVLDEVYSLLRIPGMAPEIASLSPQYRTRKLQLYIVLQELAQMSDELRPHIWSLGNVVCFAMSNIDEAYEIAQQLFRYEPKTVKMDGPLPDRSPIVEPDRGQYLQIANWIQNLEHRQCITKLYESDRRKSKYIQYIPRTRDIPFFPVEMTLDELKQWLLEKRCVRVRDALEVINQRKIEHRKSPPQVEP